MRFRFKTYKLKRRRKRKQKGKSFAKSSGNFGIFGEKVQEDEKEKKLCNDES